MDGKSGLVIFHRLVNVSCNVVIKVQAAGKLWNAKPVMEESDSNKANPGS